MILRFFQRRAERKLEEERSQRREIEERQAGIERKLQNPEFGEIERVFGRPISRALRALYENQEEIRRSHVTRIVPGRPKEQWHIYICDYFPLDRQQAEGGWNPDGVHFAFAGDGSGSEWVVDPTKENAEIKYLEHESNELKPTGVRFCDFLGLAEEET